MQTVSIDIYKFDELDDDAKEKAISTYRYRGHGYAWVDEYKDSLNAFVEHFGVRIKDYSIGTCSYSYIETDAGKEHFRGLKLKSFSRDNMPTGFCADCDLWLTFYDHFKKTGDAKGAFNEAIDAFVKAWVNDMEHQESDEYIAEMLTINEYDFESDGTFY